MNVDMIVPTYRPDETFCLLLQKLREQTFHIGKLFILNTEEILWKKALSRFPIGETLKKLPFDWEVCHIKKQEFDHGGTRNYGASLSDADILVFMTQDAVPADDRLVERLTEPFDVEEQGKGAVAVSYARQLPREDCGIIERYTRVFNYPPESRIKGREDKKELGIKTYFCSDVCAAYRRDLFDGQGGFETPVIFNEDMFFAAAAVNAGYRVAYAAAACVVHSHNYTLGQQFHRNFDLAVSQTMHPEIFSEVSSEAEGMRLVKSTVHHLCAAGKPWLVPYFFMQCAAKYAGYFFGKRWEKLPKKAVLAFTMNREYWSKIYRKRI